MDLLREATEHLNKPIVLVLGRICAGKGTYCYQFPEKKHIVVSDIVKRIGGVRSRSDLQETGDLDRLIAEELIKEIRLHDEDVLVDGIRQLSILRAILQEFGKDKVDVLWLEVPKRERSRRFESRGRRRDDIPFDQADIRDENLGIGDVETWAKQRGRVIHNY